MKNLLTTYLIVLSLAFIGQSCDSRPDTLEAHFMDAEFNFINPEGDTLGLQINCRYNLLRSTRERLENKYGFTGYRDSLMVPIITSVSSNILKKYSAGEIYNEKRSQIERRITSQVRAAFAVHDVELVEIFMASVRLPDQLQKRLENEYLKKSRKNKSLTPFRVKILERTNWNIRIDTLESREFDDKTCFTKPEWLKPVKGDSLLEALAARYSTIVVSDSCCMFNTSGQSQELCRQSRGEDKLRTGYKAIGYKNSCLMVERWAYEDGSILCFNPVTGHYAYLGHQPHFIGTDIVWDADDFYGDSEFVIADLQTGKYFGFIIYGWDITGYCRKDKNILIGFQSGAERKYLKLDIQQ